MITIHVTPDDLVNMRFAYSPLVEIAHSYRVLINPALHGPHHHWVEEACRAIYDLPLPYLEALIPRWRGCFPNFLLPSPRGNRVNLEDEIGQILITPDEQVRVDVQKLIEADGDTAMRQHFMSHPRKAVRQVIEELRVYWQHALAHYWSRMVSIKERDVLYRGRILALDGPHKLFENLHPTISCQSRQINIEPVPLTANGDGVVTLSGDGIQLVPIVITGCGRCFKSVQSGPSSLAYSVRGAGLWGAKPPSLSLELALGAGRAQVLQALVIPASTGELACRLLLTSGAVSQQLDRLKQAGLVEAYRSGKRMYYQLTRRGEELIALFERIL
jgi:DNA-binding transcriptional ArsR family regulator